MSIAERILMSEWQAVGKRVSCRAYEPRKIEQDLLMLLEEKAREINGQTGLRFQLVTADGTVVPFLKLEPRMFDGQVSTYAALIGPDDLIGAEKVGYYSERLILFATQLGLGTCWVAGTYDKHSVSAAVPEGMKLWGVVPIGYAVKKTPLKQKMIRAGIRARDRKLEQFIEGDRTFDALPEWLRTAVEAVKMGPSAVNQQPVNFAIEGTQIRAKLRKNANGLNCNDLGIAKYQFKVGAESQGVIGEWRFGDGEEFCIKGSCM